MDMYQKGQGTNSNALNIYSDSNKRTLTQTEFRKCM